VAKCTREGVLFLFDYGVSLREYYATDRSDGWLRCHFRHHAHSNPLIYPGIQDLTSWVNFSQIAEVAVERGLQVEGYVTQAQFMLYGGLQEEMEDFASLPTAAQMELSSQIKVLMMPGEMGENVKCIGLSKGSFSDIACMTRADRAHTL
jgi:SAM-dependent MidA family methyltransferase